MVVSYFGYHAVYGYYFSSIGFWLGIIVYKTADVQCMYAVASPSSVRHVEMRVVYEMSNSSRHSATSDRCQESSYRTEGSLSAACEAGN